MRLLVRDVMTTSVATARVDTPFKEIVRLLAERGVSALPVVDERDRLVGVVSEADLLLKEEYRGGELPRSFIHPKRLRMTRAKVEGDVAAELMTTPVITIGPDASLVEAAKVMAARQVKRLPVTDADGALIGIVSRADLVKVFLRTDQDIKDEITNQVFAKILLVEPHEYDVNVSDGVVTLTGQLDRRSSVEIAERLTRAVDGVVDVINKLAFRFDDSEGRVLRSVR